MPHPMGPKSSASSTDTVFSVFWIKNIRNTLGVAAAHGNERNETYLDGHVESNKAVRINSENNSKAIWACDSSKIVSVVNK